MTLHIRHIFYLIIPVVLVFVVALAGCTDDPIYKEVEIPDAEVQISGEVIFRPLVSTKVQTQSRADAPAGEKYKGIKSLYIFFFNQEGEKLDYSGEVSFTPAPSDGGTHEHVTFKKKVPAGRYYVFAVANISVDQKSELENVTTKEDLRAFRLAWNDEISKDIEMFGVFKQGYTEGSAAPDNESFEADELLTVTPDNNRLHSWVRRTASKVTVDFDGTKLKDGVTVYIKSATLKDVPSGALLGASSAVGEENGFACTTSNYSIAYGEGEEHGAWPAVTKTGTVAPPADWGVKSFHDDNAKALPCYENMQGTHEDKSKLQDKDGDGIIDSKTKDGVDNGTYLEVEGYYVANRPEYKSQGKIIYRFMLGKDAVNNFDLVRNHHYKITMQFKDYGNDIDWHIEYAEKYLDATYPKDVNYQGKFFVPELNYDADHANAGHDFDNQNVITVTSYAANGVDKKWIEPNITYTYYSYNDDTKGWDIDNTSSGWLTTNSGNVSEDGTQKEYTFVASMTEPVSTTINSLFPSVSKGSKDKPFNLSSVTGGTNLSDIENTANCYMVGAPGWYCFPLVYGNAITDKKTNSAAYGGSIVNHLNKSITSPYIIENNGITLNETSEKALPNIKVRLIWQDAQNLIETEEDKLVYDPSLFGGRGGIKFHIGTLQEGNAVIALIDEKASEDDFVEYDHDEGNGSGIYGTVGSTKAIWSWHIWATRFGTDDFEKNIQITNHDGKTFDVMPVNLGWCSGGREIKYYKRRKCVITFKVGEHEIERTIVQYPHFLLPRGDHPYYQWGRKDPFVGTNTAFGNKQRWDHDGTLYDVYSQYNPPRLYKDYVKVFNQNKERKSTKDCLDVLVKNPDKWHNATRKENPDSKTDYDKFLSDNDAPSDLWSSNGDKKTVYDPCPAGYQVSDETAFTGFTTIGIKATFPYDWYDVVESNMQGDYYTGESINKQVLELYTDPRKLQSIIFPVTGYRDYDAKAEVYKYPGDIMGEGYIWFNKAKDRTNSYHFKYHRNDIVNNGTWRDRGSNDLNLIAPYEAFYNTDGFGVRPVRIYTK